MSSLPSLRIHLDDTVYKPYHLLDQISPVLPKDFDKRLLPQNICQNQYLLIKKCQTRFEIKSNKTTCSSEIKTFLLCKTKRDTIIFDRIKEWQIKHFNKYDKENRAFYLQGLTFKLNRLNESFQLMANLFSNECKRKIMNGEINQLKWRLRYLRKIQQQKMLKK